MYKKLLVLLVALILLVSCGKTTKPEETKPEETKTVETPSTGDLAINVYTRDASSGTREAFESGVGLKKGEITVNAVETSGNGDIAQKTGADEAGIGYVSLTTNFDANNLQKIKFNGVEATEANVLDQSYKLSRPFSYVTRAEDDYANEATKAAVHAFLDFIHNSNEGLEAVEAAGGIVDKSKAKAWSELAGNHPELDASVTIRTAGSTSVEKTLQAALEA